MAIGASGSRIQLLARIVGSQPVEGSTLNVMIIAYWLSEPTIDGNNLDGKLSGDVGFEIDLRQSDTQIEMSLRARLAAQLTQDLTPTEPFISSDVRFGLSFSGQTSGAVVLIGAETDGVAIDFIDRSMAIRDVATPANVYSGLPTAKLTITRASAAYYLNSSGILTLAGVNEARYDCYPGTLLPRGLLSEEARTNLALQSENAATSWTNSNITVTTNTGLGMRGTTTADRLTATADNATHTQAIAATAVAHTYSPWLRRISGSGVINISADGVTWVAVDIGTVLTRFETTLVLTAATYNPGIQIVTSGDEIEVWGEQFEAGGYASSYIQTTTVPVTRSADVCSLSGTLFPLSQTAGTLIMEAEYPGNVRGSGAAGAAGTMALSDGTGNEIIRLDANNGFVSSRLSVDAGGVNQAGPVLSGAVINTPQTSGGVYAVNDFHHARDGVLSGSPDTSGSLPTTTGMYLGSLNGTSINCAWYRKIMYLPRRVTNAELQALTT